MDKALFTTIKCEALNIIETGGTLAKALKFVTNATVENRTVERLLPVLREAWEMAKTVKTHRP